MRVAFIDNLIDEGSFFEVQGSAEPYYVYSYLDEKENCNLSIFSNAREEILADNTNDYFKIYYHNPFTLSFQLIRVLISLTSYDVIYSYRGKIITFFITFFSKIVLRKKLIFDLRTPPVEQAIDFAKEAGTLTKKKAFKIKIWKIMYKIVLPRADRIITVSDNNKKLLVNEYGIPPGKIFVLPLGVDLDKFNPNRYEKYSNKINKNSMICVTSIGGYWRAKGIKTLIDSLEDLKLENIDLSLTIVGSAPDYIIDHLNDCASEKGVKDSLEFAGYIQHDEIPSLLAEYEYVVSPIPDLRAYQLASATKVFEYLAMGKATIVSNVDCNTQIIRNKYNGIVYEPNNPSDLSQKIFEIIKNPKIKRKIEKRSRKSVKSHSWELMLKDIERIIEEEIKEI